MLANRLRAWVEARQLRTDSWTLNQRNLYILPTRGGWGFCLTLLVMLIAAINYQLNLGYALTFLLGGAALVSLHQTHANLRGLTLRLRSPAPVFAGQPATLEVVLDNPARRDRPAVGLGLYAARRRGMAFTDVPVQGNAVARLRFTPDARGRHPVPTLLVETHFPFGLFRSWSVWRPAADLLVYPAPEHPPQPLPAGQPVPGTSAAARRGAGGEFEGVRAFRRGDTPRQVVWKKVARSGELVSRDMGQSANRTLLLDWALAGQQPTEARLSRLAAWVLAAEEQGLAWGLHLPGRPHPVGSGELHLRQALEALATWQVRPAAEAAEHARAEGAGHVSTRGPATTGRATPLA